MKTVQKIVWAIVICLTLISLGCKPMNLTPYTPETVYGTGAGARASSDVKATTGLQKE